MKKAVVVFGVPPNRNQASTGAHIAGLFHGADDLFIPGPQGNAYGIKVLEDEQRLLPGLDITDQFDSLLAEASRNPETHYFLTELFPPQFCQEFAAIAGLQASRLPPNLRLPARLREQGSSSARKQFCVIGSPFWKEQDRLNEILHRLVPRTAHLLIGDRLGAESFAAHWALKKGFSHTIASCKSSQYGDQALMVRNHWMIWDSSTLFHFEEGITEITSYMVRNEYLLRPNNVFVIPATK